MSSDVEGRMYEHAKSLGITLITISLRYITFFFHPMFLRLPNANFSYRPSLMKYHTNLLTLAGDGSGRWTLSRVGTAEELMGIDREVISLEAKLAEVGNWERRVKELDGLLSAQEPTDDDTVIV